MKEKIKLITYCVTLNSTMHTVVSARRDDVSCRYFNQCTVSVTFAHRLLLVSLISLNTHDMIAAV